MKLWVRDLLMDSRIFVLLTFVMFNFTDFYILQSRHLHVLLVKCFVNIPTNQFVVYINPKCCVSKMAATILSDLLIVFAS